ncbi:MAG: tetratricopeptide repeat protein [Bacteroidales bacterium]
MMKKFTSLLILLTALLISQQAAGQQPAAHKEPGATYREARALFNNEKYGAARQLFLETIRQIDDPQSELQASATLYSAICAAELDNPDTEKLLLSFLDQYPTHAGQKLAWFQMGNLKYKKRSYRQAARWYGRLNNQDVERERRNEFLFKKGYSLFMTDSHARAQRLFKQITDPADGYHTPATYYSGHIDYLNGDYDAAMRAFRTLENDRQFGDVVPFYITHIFYMQERYDTLLEYAPPLLEEAPPQQVPEISRLIGSAFFHRSDYTEAIPYLETFMEDSREESSREDHYHLGFAYYISGRYDEAIPHLERATGEEDPLAQNAYYHLASCYIETDQKRYARNAFTQAHELDFHEDIAREALFHYALLSLEMSYDPYNEAIPSFQKYIREYPESSRTEEAYGYLVDLYLTTNNYKDALSSLENTSLDTPKLREAYQRVTFYRGVELFNNGDFRNAIDLFSRTQRFTENRELTAASFYWQGEAYFRIEEYEASIQAHEEFLVTPGAFSLDYFNRAHYSIGYAHFKLDRYSQAISPFRNYISETSDDDQMVNDATLRAADAYFMSKQYQQALTWYQRAININVIDTDYAVFQKGLVEGVLSEFEDKISTMEQLISNHPRSSFVDDGKYEIANTWLLLDNSDRAEDYFSQVISQHPNSPYVQSAMLKTGLIHYNNSEDEKALDMFRQVIEEYQGTAQAREALMAMRNIYVEMDRVDEFVRFSESHGMADISAAQQDSLTYQAAENRYMQGNCTEAIQSFSNYLDRFPEGVFASHANFYRSECYYRTNQQQQALPGYQYVIEQPGSRFRENALLRASAIEYNADHYETALSYFSELEEVAENRNNLLVARKGIMRCLYRLEQFDEAQDAALQVLESDLTDQDTEQEAYLVRGISAMETGNNPVAVTALERASEITTNERAAEAMYYLALITFNEGDYEKAEEQIFEYSNQMSAYDEWLARTFLLLADVYIETENTFQARATLESLIENYDGREILEKARSRLDFVRELEKESAEPGSENPDN